MDDNINKIINVLKEFESSKIKDYEFWAYQINKIFTGFEPAKYLIVDENGTTLQDLISKLQTENVSN